MTINKPHKYVIIPGIMAKCLAARIKEIETLEGE